MTEARKEKDVEIVGTEVGISEVIVEIEIIIEIEILEGVMTEICLSVMNLTHLNVEILQSMLQQFQEIKELHQKFCHPAQSI